MGQSNQPLVTRNRAITPTEIRRYAAFCFRPSLSIPPSHRKIQTALTMVAVALTSVFVIVVTTSWVWDLYDPPSTPLPDTSLTEDIVLASLVVPLLEEGAFRLGLSKSRWQTILGSTLLALFGLLIFAGGTDPISLTIVGLVALVAVWQTLHRFWPTARLSVFRGRYLIWFSSFTFGVLHITNFDTAEFDYRFLWAIPLYTASQIVGGVELAYVRIRAGFWAAVVVHGLFNLVITLLSAWSGG